jgi:hypothetical protein
MEHWGLILACSQHKAYRQAYMHPESMDSGSRQGTTHSHSQHQVAKQWASAGALMSDRNCTSAHAYAALADPANCLQSSSVAGDAGLARLRHAVVTNKSREAA